MLDKAILDLFTIDEVREMLGGRESVYANGRFPSTPKCLNGFQQCLQLSPDHAGKKSPRQFTVENSRDERFKFEFSLQSRGAFRRG